MKRIRTLMRKASKPLELLLTLLHFLSMRTLDILTGEPALKARRAASRLLLEGAAFSRVRRVKFRRTKCIENPLDCALCLRSCPEGVFFTYPLKREHGRVCDVYELVVAFKSRCTGCGVCVEACPRNALRVG